MSASASPATPSSISDYGILGVGEIAEAIVIGLCERNSNPPEILLSPRNELRATALASRYASVSVGRDNQALVNGCSTVVALRPDKAEPVLAPLSFAVDQAVISVMAGVSVQKLKPLVAPAVDISRAIPLPSLAHRPGITPVHPASVAADALFERLGGAANIDDLDAFEAMSTTTATIAAHLQYLATVSACSLLQFVATVVCAFCAGFSRCSSLRLVRADFVAGDDNLRGRRFRTSLRGRGRDQARHRTR